MSIIRDFIRKGSLHRHSKCSKGVMPFSEWNSTAYKHSLTKDYLKVPEMDGRKKFSGY